MRPTCINPLENAALTPRVEELNTTLLVGQHQTMSVANNQTGLLWKQFIPRIGEIQHRCSADKISLQVYPQDYFERFDPHRTFEKWAAVEVVKIEKLPADMSSLQLEGGLYAVFDYKGSSSDPAIFQYIFTQWLPSSDYALDDRPHFEVLGDRYRNNDPASEEEIWIPIRKVES